MNRFGVMVTEEKEPAKVPVIGNLVCMGDILKTGWVVIDPNREKSLITHRLGEKDLTKRRGNGQPHISVLRTSISLSNKKLDFGISGDQLAILGKDVVEKDTCKVLHIGHMYNLLLMSEGRIDDKLITVYEKIRDMTLTGGGLKTTDNIDFIMRFLNTWSSCLDFKGRTDYFELYRYTYDQSTKLFSGSHVLSKDFAQRILDVVQTNCK